MDSADARDRTNPGTRLILREFLAGAARELQKCAGSLQAIERRIDNVPPDRVGGVLDDLAGAVGETEDFLADLRRYLGEQALTLGR
jgi:hypothetical protein